MRLYPEGFSDDEFKKGLPPPDSRPFEATVGFTSATSSRRSSATGHLFSLNVAAELRPVERTHLALEFPLVAVDRRKRLVSSIASSHRRRLEHRVAADHFLGLGERAIVGGQLAVPRAHAETFRRRPQPGGATSVPSLVISSMSLPISRISRSLGLLAGVFIDSDHRQESHIRLLGADIGAAIPWSNERPPNRHRPSIRVEVRVSCFTVGPPRSCGRRSRSPGRSADWRHRPG